MQCIGDPAQHAERMSLIPGGFQATDLLLRGIKEICQLFLRDPGNLPPWYDGNRSRSVAFARYPEIKIEKVSSYGEIGFQVTGDA